MPKRRQETTDSRRSWAAKGKTRDVCESCRKSKIRCTGCAEFACEACTKKKILCIPAPQKNPTVRRRAASQSWTENAGPNDGLDEPVESQEDYEEQSAGSSQVEAVAGEDVDENETHISSFVSTTPEFELVFQDNMQFDNYTLMDHFIVGKFHVAMLYFNSPSQPFIVRWKFDDNLQRWSYFDGPTEPVGPWVTQESYSY
ncbi:hypothetical protein BD410DRAFT_622708 [Rickenella mellea]|uniref:Zn(2)-C6 fungal-type domain-containing protein n=1 Tax=Rickenella mellea TaxID=50990 RepID=A0A4Y7PNL8_9AGAM|nr:hypothetical protein BD410DRAFT_622708 [Rickenella mellea]